jgi:hypothetical protein
MPQTKEHLQPAEAGWDKQGSSPRDLVGSMALPTPCLGTCSFQSCETNTSTISTHHIYINLEWHPLKTST